MSSSPHTDNPYKPGVDGLAVCAGLFKQHGKVYFEAAWQGNNYKFFVPEGELPMLTGT